MLTDNLL